MPTIRDMSTQAIGTRSNVRGREKISQPGTVWRDELLPAHFDGELFHVDSGSYEGGRRIVSHEFPKKEVGYAEDMGRRATVFAVRGYVIVYPHDDENAPPLYRRDYRVARDRLANRLDNGGPGVLQLPTFKNFTKVVVCQQFRMSEDEKYGGFCTFDMQFLERGVRPFMGKPDPAVNLVAQAENLKKFISITWDQQRERTGFEGRLGRMFGSRR